MTDSKKCKQLLHQAGQYHPLYGDRLATHLPMVLSALKSLGATDEKLVTVFNESIQELQDLGSLEQTIQVDEITQYLGDSSKYKNYLEYFNTQIALLGYKTVLRASLPILLPGIAASAFHALIRLGYAIEGNNDGEIAISLAYWCAEFQGFDLGGQTTNDTLEVILEKLAPIGVNHSFSPGIIVDRMAEIGQHLTQQNCLIQPTAIDFTDIRTICLQAFYANDDFTLLHTVTACHAFSFVMPYIENMDVALKELWKAVLIAHLSTGLRYTADADSPKSCHCDFKPLILSALQSNDAHKIKLVYSCLNEYLQYKHPLYYLVAKRAVA